MCVKCHIVKAFGFQANVGAVVCIFVMLMYGRGGGISVLWKFTNGPASTQSRGSVVHISQYDLIFAFCSVFIAVIYPVVEVTWWAIHRTSKAVLGCARKRQNTGRTVGKSLREKKKMNYWTAIRLAHAVTPLNYVFGRWMGSNTGTRATPTKVFARFSLVVPRKLQS